MKWVVWSMMFSTALSWSATNVAIGGEGECKTIKVVLEGGPDGEVTERTIRLGGVPEGNVEGGMTVFVANGEVGDAGNIAYFGVDEDVANGSLMGHVVELSAINHEPNPDAGWLGIQLGSFSKVADGRQESTEGISVLNVAAGSPADRAGFEQNDVIVEVDDVAIGQDVSAFAGVVGDATAGERVKFTVLRDDQRVTLVATLGRRGDVGEVEWKHEGLNSFVFDDATTATVKMLKKGEDGEWAFEVTGEAELGLAMPHFLVTRLMSTEDGDGTRQISLVVDNDQGSVAIETTSEGQIKVTRRDAEADEESVVLYDDEDALAEGDADAFKLYSDATRSTVRIQHQVQAGETLFELSGDDDFKWVMGDAETLLETQSGSLAEMMDRMKNLHLKVQVGEDGAGPAHAFMNVVTSCVTRTIRQNPDGTIDVVAQKGSDELVKRYADEADLEARNPDAYETFLELNADDE
jgi:PDZ domain-containing protein